LTCDEQHTRALVAKELNSLTHQNPFHIFLRCSDDNQDLVEALARRLHGYARLSFWFGPWHRVLRQPIQAQIEEMM